MFYDELILEEEENVLTELLRKAAKEKLTEEMTAKINGTKWEECFDVAEDLIKDDNTPPTLPEQQWKWSVNADVSLQKTSQGSAQQGEENQHININPSPQGTLSQQ
ncbi:unnamed protein product, partial [Scomber scombrus]